MDNPRVSSVPKFLVLRNGQSIESYKGYIERNKIEFPETVYVIGGGEVGAEYIDKIPKNAYTIAANSLAHHPRRWNWIYLFDRKCVQYEYYAEEHLSRHEHVLYSDILCKNAFQFSELGIYPWLPPSCFAPYMPQLEQDEFNSGLQVLVPGILRGGATVSACSVQLAAQQPGVKRIVLCAVPFYGTGHWDGYHNPDALAYSEAWPWAELFNRFLRYVQEDLGIRVESMSPTILEVSPYGG
jgi:hypothetical protein